MRYQSAVHLALPHGPPPEPPTLPTQDLFFHEACEFIKQTGGLERGHIGPKFEALENWLHGGSGQAFLDEQCAHICILEERALSGSNAKDLLGWVRVVQVALKERGPPISGRDMGQDDLVPLFDYALVHAAPQAAFTILRPLLLLAEQGYHHSSGAWLLRHPAAAAAGDAWEIGCFRVLTCAIDRWRRFMTQSSLYAAMAEHSMAQGPSACSALASPTLERAAALTEEQVWMEAGASGYIALLRERMSMLVRGACEVIWASLEPREGKMLSIYPVEQAWKLEMAHAQLFSPSNGLPSQLQVQLALALPTNEEVLATVHLHQTESRVLLFQTTPGGGYRSVCRVCLSPDRRVTLTVERDVASSQWRLPVMMPSVSVETAALEDGSLVQDVTEADVVIALPHAGTA